MWFTEASTTSAYNAIGNITTGFNAPPPKPRKSDRQVFTQDIAITGPI